MSDTMQKLLEFNWWKALAGLALFALLNIFVSELVIAPIRHFIKHWIAPYVHQTIFDSVAFAYILLAALVFLVVALAFYVLGDFVRIDWHRKNERYKRFEDFSKTGVRFGFVPFHPTLQYDSGTADAHGFGVDVLRWVFREKSLTQAGPRSTWGNAIARLNANHYDVLATPLYELRQRTRQVAFTSPLFYADIGAFVPARSPIFDQVEANGLSFPELCKILDESSHKMTVRMTKGELQHHFCKKYISKATAVYVEEEFSIPEFLKSLSSEDGEKRSDIFFCERWQAERQSSFGARDGFRNVLRRAELLLPVGFVVRKADDTLRKFINLQLLAMQRDDHKNVIDFLIQSFPGSGHDDSIKDCYFIGYEQEKLVPGAPRIVNLDDHR